MSELLGLYFAVVLCPIGVFLLLIWLVRGKKSNAMRAMGAGALIIGLLGFAVARFF